MSSITFGIWYVAIRSLLPRLSIYRASLTRHLPLLIDTIRPDNIDILRVRHGHEDWLISGLAQQETDRLDKQAPEQANP